MARRLIARLIAASLAIGFFVGRSDRFHRPRFVPEPTGRGDRLSVGQRRRPTHRACKECGPKPVIDRVIRGTTQIRGEWR